MLLIYSMQPCVLLCDLLKNGHDINFQIMDIKNPRNRCDYEVSTMELLGGFEPPTSSLPRMRSTY